jgi:penicillin-binding protein 2
VDTPEYGVWQGGDMTNMIIGQGDVLVTPLQIGNGYAAIARRQMLRPHLFMSALDSNQQPVLTYQAQPPTTTPEIDLDNIQRVENGLKKVIKNPESKQSFENIPIVLAGKSGTGEASGKKDAYSWYVAYGPVEKPKYCVVCLVEQGGGGSTTAIQGVAQTFASIYKSYVGSIHIGAATGLAAAER